MTNFGPPEPKKDETGKIDEKTEPYFAIFYNKDGEVIEVQKITGEKGKKIEIGKDCIDKVTTLNEIKNKCGLESSVSARGINGVETTTILFEEGNSPCWVRDSSGRWWYIC